MYSLSISWVAPSNGGDSITDYKVYWDQAMDTYIVIGSSTAGLTNFVKALAADGSNAGKTYNFKISALNSVGESPLSDAYAVVASTIPDPP
jgi:hypothetical protein